MSVNPLNTNYAKKCLRDYEKESAKTGLKIKVKKTKEMRIAMTNKEPLYIHNEIIERVTHFTYLGSIIDNTGGNGGGHQSSYTKGPSSI